MAQPNTSSVCSVDTPKRANVPWKTNSYDDEAILLNIRLTYHQAEWSAITDMFNKAVPVQRARSEAGVACKGRSLVKACRELENATKEVNHTHSTDPQHPSWHAAYLPSLAEGRQDRALNMETISSFWDSSFDSEGYSGVVLEEFERLAMAQAALEAAAGTRRQ